jgi:crotonobetainyl-CoA:carnitine CoA-transferase CaiB-like acyl-CoA transferase
MADLGAEVIKVEEPTLGDPSRQAPPRVKTSGEPRSALSALLLSGHRSIALDLYRAPAREVLEELLKTADVFVETFRPGVLARWGLDPGSLRKRHPRLVICSLSGWGQDGPMAPKAGHDLTYQAMAGSLAAATGEAPPAVPSADIVGAWGAFASVLAALLRRERDGQGCWIDHSLYEAAGHAAITAWAAEADGPKAVGEALQLSGALPCYDIYRTRDGGRLAVAALEPKFWRRFCQVAGRPELISRQYSTDPEVHRRVAELVAERSRDEWAELLEPHDVSVAPVLALSEAREHPQMLARGLLRTAEDGLPRLAYPARFDGKRPGGAEAFPELGGATGEVLAELGRRGPGPLARRRAGIGPRSGWKRRLFGWVADGFGGKKR